MIKVERFIVELTKRAKAKEIDFSRIENLTTVGCMGKVEYCNKGRAKVSNQLRFPNPEDFAKSIENANFVLIDIGKFIKKFNELGNDITDVKPVAEKTVSKSAENNSYSSDELNIFSKKRS